MSFLERESDRQARSAAFDAALTNSHTYQYWRGQACEGKTPARQKIGYKRQIELYWRMKQEINPDPEPHERFALSSPFRQPQISRQRVGV